MPTDYLIFCFQGDPVYDALPVLKVTHYPDEPASYKPFAQGILCMQGETLRIRLWAFESKPEAQSTLAVALEGTTGACFTLSADLSGRHNIALDGAPCATPIDIRPIAGEDLQGEYWGVDIVLPVEITTALGISDHRRGTHIKGNLYKLCRGEHPHFGSFAPTPDRSLTACPATFELAPF